MTRSVAILPMVAALLSSAPFVAAGPIHEAAKSGDLAGLQKLASNPGQSINEQDAEGYTALHWSVIEGRLKLVPWLLKNGAGVSIRSNYNETALMLAGRYGRPQTAIRLIEAGADVSDMTSVPGISPAFCFTAVSLAAENNHPEVLKVLLDHGADVNGQNDRVMQEQENTQAYPCQHEFPIELAVRNRNREIIKLLVERGSLTSRAVGFAIVRQDREMMDYLFSLGVKPDAYALEKATEQHDGALIRYLSEKGATAGEGALLNLLHGQDRESLRTLLDNTSRDQYIATLKALSFQANPYYGSKVPSVAIMQLLLDHDPVAAKQAPVLLHAAATHNAVDVVKLLLDRGFPVNARDEFGNIPLHWAAQTGRPESVRLLLDRGADVSARNDRDNSPLHRAIPTGVLEVVRLLVERDANINVQNDAGATPLHMAAARNQGDIADLLRRHGADPGIRNGRGETAGEVAKSHGFTDLARRLGTVPPSPVPRTTDSKAPVLAAIPQPVPATTAPSVNASFSHDRLFAPHAMPEWPGDIVQSGGIGMKLPKQAENGEVVPFMVAVSPELVAGDQLTVFVNHVPAGTIQPVGTVTLTGFSSRFRMPGSGALHVLVTRKDGSRQSATAVIQVTVAARIPDTGVAGGDIKTRIRRTGAENELLILQNNSMARTGHIEQIQAQLPNGAVEIGMTPWFSSNPLVGVRTTQPLDQAKVLVYIQR